MGQDNPLINIDTSGLTEPAKLLIKKMASGCGILYDPIGKVRQAKAEVKVKKLQALGEIELSEIQQRALNRFIQEETIIQQNIENITHLALPQLEKDSRPNEIDNDWLHNFFEKSKCISDEEMQALWAKVLAGEANKPNSYSKRTVNFMANIDKNEAKLFTEFCSFAIYYGKPKPLIYEYDHEIYLKKEIHFEAIKHLENIGLVTYSELSSFGLQKRPKQILIHYFGTPINIEFKGEKENKFDLGKVLLTRIGEELAPISGAKFDKEFFEYILKKWQEEGYCVSSPLPLKIKTT